MDREFENIIIRDIFKNMLNQGKIKEDAYLLACNKTREANRKPVGVRRSGDCL
ncbi:MAG: hypothetical protein J6M06_02720 [Synergistaceae bacterium]|nr:hypothetical protein [Synergistaceae bacterium]